MYRAALGGREQLVRVFSGETDCPTAALPAGERADTAEMALIAQHKFQNGAVVEPEADLRSQAVAAGLRYAFDEANVSEAQIAAALHCGQCRALGQCAVAER